MRTSQDPIDWQPERIAIAGTSGSGKTTFGNRVAHILGYPKVEIDSLYHGENWEPRESFVDDVEKFVAGDQWVIELQYRQVRPLILARADTVLWLDYPTSTQMRRLIPRTLRRRLKRETLWNGNQEPALRTIFTDRDHIIRWGWRTRNTLRETLPELLAEHSHVRVIRFRHPRDAQAWLESLC